MSEKKDNVVIPSDEEVAKYGGKAQAAPAEEAVQPAQPGSSTEAQATTENRPAADDWRDIALRAKAELSNYQKRAEKDRSEGIRFANGSFAKALLPVLDNLERMLNTAAGGEVSTQALIDGAKLTLEMFRKVLREYHVEPIAAEGQPFDPQVHEAMLEQPSDHAERMVLQELDKGYKLHDRVLRPAKVIVSKPTPSAETANDSPLEE